MDNMNETLQWPFDGGALLVDDEALVRQSAASDLPPGVCEWACICRGFRRQTVGAQGDAHSLALLAKNHTEPENAVSRFLQFQCLTGTENGGSS